MEHSDSRESIFIVTDLCMWEKNKQEGGNDTHAIIVIDEKTGQNRMIRGGSRIRFIDGEITEPQTQADYNNQSRPAEPEWPKRGDMFYRINSQGEIVSGVWTGSPKQENIIEFIKSVSGTEEERQCRLLWWHEYAAPLVVQ